MTRRSEERRRTGEQYNVQRHRVAMRRGLLPCAAVRSELVTNVPDRDAGCWCCWPSRRCSRAEGRAEGRAQGGRPLDRPATAAAARGTFDLATVTWREAKPVVLAPEHQRRRFHSCEVDACWPM